MIALKYNTNNCFNNLGKFLCAQPAVADLYNIQLCARPSNSMPVCYMVLHLVRVTVSTVTVYGFGFRVKLRVSFSIITVEIVVVLSIKVNNAISGAFLPRQLCPARYMPWSCVCLSVCVCPSQVGVLLKWLYIGKRKQRQTPRDSSFLLPKIFLKFERGHPQRGRQMQVG